MKILLKNYIVLAVLFAVCTIIPGEQLRHPDLEILKAQRELEEARQRTEEQRRLAEEARQRAEEMRFRTEESRRQQLEADRIFAEQLRTQAKPESGLFSEPVSPASDGVQLGIDPNTQPQAQPETTIDPSAKDKEAKTPEKSLEEQITEHIQERVKFRKRAEDDPQAYEKRIRTALDEYAKDIGSKLGLLPSQRKELRLALSEGIMKQKEMIISIKETGAAIVGGLSRLADERYAGGNLEKYGILPEQVSDIKRMDSRSFDFRSTEKRLQDVMTREPFDSLEARLKLTPKQKERLNTYRNELVDSFNYKARTMYDNVRTKMAKSGYTALRVTLLAIVLAGVLKLLKYY